ncbi:hypothetical protein EYF80_060912 [Liparis tanakae]|uniref:Uncharacterized protein n=1 Tax=Liparis tanakae TaxID=230148 RepID=A0A4Z2EJG6_9TELE|nr:hypothetical protein EYF80_060912 [Liparis tanakae]
MRSSADGLRNRIRPAEERRRKKIDIKTRPLDSGTRRPDESAATPRAEPCIPRSQTDGDSRIPTLTKRDSNRPDSLWVSTTSPSGGGRENNKSVFVHRFTSAAGCGAERSVPFLPAAAASSAPTSSAPTSSAPTSSAPTQPSSASSWQPLHTPRLSVSARRRKRSNSAFARGLYATVAAQPRGGGPELNRVRSQDVCVAESSDEHDRLEGLQRRGAGAQALQLEAGVLPQCPEAGQRLPEHLAPVHANADLEDEEQGEGAPNGQPTDTRRRRAPKGAPPHLGLRPEAAGPPDAVARRAGVGVAPAHGVGVAPRRLQDQTQLLAEQQLQVGGALRRQLHLDAAVPGERHLQQAGDEAAVADVVPRGQQAVAQSGGLKTRGKLKTNQLTDVNHSEVSELTLEEFLRGVETGGKQLRLLQVRRAVAQLAVALSEGRAAQPVAARAERNPQEHA